MEEEDNETVDIRIKVNKNPKLKKEEDNKEVDAEFISKLF